jgi:hypothetical protein
VVVPRRRRGCPTYERETGGREEEEEEEGEEGEE